MSTNIIDALSSNTNLTLTPNQERIWFLQNLSTSDYPLTVSGQLILHALDPARLENSLAALLTQVPQLRLTAANVDGTPQAQHGTFSASDVLSYETLPDEATRQSRIQQLTRQPFNLANGPLLRVVVLAGDRDQTTLLCVAHQILMDRLSLHRFTEALAALYAGGSDAALSLAPAESTTASPKAETITWWQEQLTAVEPLEFPIDHTRPPSQRYERQAFNFTTDDSSWQALEAQAKANNCSIETILLGAFTALLYRYANAEDLLLGLTDHGGGSLENLVPLRMQINPAMSFSALLDQAQAKSADSLSHAIPFATLLQAISVERDLSRAPLLQSAFTWAGDVAAPTGTQAGDLPALTADLLDLHLVGYRWDGQLRFRFEYDNAIFEADSVARIAEHYSILLAAALKTPAASIIDLPLMSAEERATVLVDWNQTAFDYPHDQCLHQLIEEQVARTPDSIAAIQGDTQITYAELNRRANQLAHYLQAQGVQPDDLVGVHLERTFDMLVAVLAVLKSGGGYVPLDPNFPQDRLTIIAEDARIKVLITHSAIASFAPQHDGATVRIDEIQAEVGTLDTNNPTSAVQPDNIAYVIFTSGSTGRPKGVQIQHQSAVNFLMSMQVEPGLAASDVLLAVTTLSFDIAVLELYLPLLTGATIILATYEDVLDGRRLLELIDRHKVTLLQATPATWQLMLEAGWESSPSVTALCGGEALPLELAEKIVARCAALWNMYGPTETTVWSTVEPIRDITDFISIGHPIKNTTVYILDAAGNPTPIGVPGELTIGGDGLARGYFERPDLTAEKFIPDPFIAQTGLAGRDALAANPRMYRTGDVARYLPDGRLQFYGRVDHQVKVRGFRIELGEIETTLSKYAAIKQNVVIVREDTPGNKQIVAYLILNAGEILNQRDLRDFLKEHLPNYMVPALFVTLEQFPLTPNGKINRRALPKPDMSEAVGGAEYIAPRNDTEAKIAEIWAEALNLPQVSVADNFFELGGHSILAIRIFTQIEKAFGQSLPLATLFRAPTVGQLAALISDEASSQDENLHPALVPIQANGKKPPVFCVGGGIINLNNLARRLHPDQPFYALQWQGVDVDRVMDITLEEVAALFISAMKTIQPEGPYYLASSFSAGVIVIEMALQLQDNGEKIAMMTGFDTTLDGHLFQDESGVRLKKKKRGKVAKILNFAKIVIRNPSTLKVYITDPIYWDNLRHQGWKIAVKFYTTINRPIPLKLRSGIYEEFFILRVNAGYKPRRPYDGDLQIYLSPPYYERYGKYPKYGWGGLVSGEVRVNETPGEPCTIMLTPQVDELALMFKTQLDQF